MFSYSIKIRRLNKPGSKLKAFVSLTIDDIMQIEGYKIIEGSNGLFVTPPSHKGTVMEEGVSVEKYFDDVRFLGEQGLELSKEIKESILRQFNNSSESRVASAKAQVKAQVKAQSNEPSNDSAKSDSKSSATPERARKPLWGFS